MEEKSFQILIKMVEVQNFVRTKRVVNICKYIDVCDNFIEYLVLIALLETECIDLIQVLETVSKHRREINVSVIQKIFELICKSKKRRDLSKLLIKYYFEDQKYISKDFTKIKAKSKSLKDLVIINTIKNISEYFSYNECLVTALFGYLHIYLEKGEKQIILNNPVSYTSARTLVTMEPETYDNTDERFLAETCVFWMKLFDKNLKEKMIKEYKSIIQRLSNTNRR
jgi:hypothetical protein